MFLLVSSLIPKRVSQNHRLRWLSDALALCYEKIQMESVVLGILPDFWRTSNKPPFFFGCLGCFSYREKITPCPLFLDFRMQLIDVVAYTEHKDFQFYFGFSTQQKFLKFIIIFQNAKSSFYLDGTVHPIFDTRFTQDIFIGFLPLLQKAFWNI